MKISLWKLDYNTGGIKMLTVQEILNKTNIEELVKQYIYKYPNEKDSIEELVKLIKNMQSIELTPDKEHICVLFAYRQYSTDFDDIGYGLTYLDEDKIETYAYEFSSLSEIAAFYVSDNELTQSNLLELLVDVLYEASFFGFEQEDLAQERQKLEDALEEVKSGNYKSYSMEEVFGEYKDTETDASKEMKTNINKMVFEYNQLMKKEEIDKMKK